MTESTMPREIANDLRAQAMGALHAWLVRDKAGFDVVVGSERPSCYITSLAQLEAQEGDRCANFASKAGAAGLAPHGMGGRATRSADGEGGSTGTEWS
jgi:hypothetical protein